MTRAAATAVLLAAAACDSAPAPIHTIHTDSAGIPIAAAVTPLWGPGDGWPVEAEPLVEIGTVTGDPEYQFSDVVAAVRLGNGDIPSTEPRPDLSRSSTRRRTWCDSFRHWTAQSSASSGAKWSPVK